MAVVARNADYTKEYNRKLFMRLLRYHPLSRAEIARRTGLTRACTSLIASELLSEGLIYELEPIAGQRGRSATPLMLSEKAGYAIGIYLNRDGCSAGLVDAGSNVLNKRDIRLESPTDQLPILLRALSEMLDASAISSSQICGIGISAPGPLDSEAGHILNPPRFDLWHQTDICTLLSEQIKIPVFLANNATSLASYLCGRPGSYGSSNYLLLLVDSGIGSGVISAGKVLQSYNHFTSELGHVSINYKGRVCACGNIGCLEEYAALPKLLQGTGLSSWKQVVDQIDSNPEARSLFYEEVDYLSAGIVNLCNMVYMDTVLLAGDIAYCPNKLATALEERINMRCIYHDRCHISVRVPAAVEGIQILSAAELAFRQALGL